MGQINAVNKSCFLVSEDAVVAFSTFTVIGSAGKKRRMSSERTEYTPAANQALLTHRMPLALALIHFEPNITSYQKSVNFDKS